ncbi:exodeoxyribonuclease VII small subunit [Paenalkalicoccus suaedae]|uniref:Exodeoxyribonuclease 7 small subunit n=1 Tax=Paenalkalicoccus suaedae TaxID=2592382 RepID=A0A859FFF3_9BACI|nr:exodeoxyribonuclease VII small subunit [Paenalkalicoccus suaedae]QKS70966.1 exodeoxyribonuclease VII small subunit [Paenalkalicoccus suaedae]
MAEKDTLSFEDQMRKLEEVVNKLEQGDVPLEQAIDMFQQGMALSKQCHDKLQKVEKQMTEVLHEDGEITTFQVEE